MKRTDFAVYLNKYFTDYLVNNRGSTARTVDSYRYAFVFLLEYYHEELKIAPDKIRLDDITYDNIKGFYNWLQEHLNNGTATRNHRQSVINSFVRFLTFEKPEYLAEYQKILGIPVKKAPVKEISYLKPEGMRLFMNQIQLENRDGLRDYLMMTILYTTGIRVSELTGIKVKDLSLSIPYTLLVHGKGQKSRFVPLNTSIIPLINQYLKVMHYDDPSKMDNWLFINHMGNQFTRQGICYIVQKYAKKARDKEPDLVPADMSPHKIRHSTAMGLVAAGVDLIYIRDLLGHVSVRTTESYARADSKLKREAIEAASKELVPKEDAAWESNTSLKKWLKDFCRPVQ